MDAPFQIFCAKIRSYVVDHLKTDDNFRHINCIANGVHMIDYVDPIFFVNGEPLHVQVIQKSLELWHLYDDAAKIATINL